MSTIEYPRNYLQLFNEEIKKKQPTSIKIFKRDIHIMRKQSLRSYIAGIFSPFFWGHSAFLFLGMPPTYIQHFCYSKGRSHISALVKCAHPFHGRRHTEIWILRNSIWVLWRNPAPHSAVRHTPSLAGQFKCWRIIRTLLNMHVCKCTLQQNAKL